MKKSKNSEIKAGFSRFKSPYNKQSDDINDIYEKYKNDPKRIKIIDGEKYYKIMESFCLNLRGRKPILIVAVDKNISLKIDDTVIDNYGHKFKVEGSSFIRFFDRPPEWYLNKVIFLDLSGGFRIGEYIRKFN